MKHLPFSVIESRWFKSGNDSVKSCFEAIASIHCDKSDGFIHHSFNNKSSLKTAIDECSSDEVTKVIYLATHGNRQAIGPDNQTISSTVLKNMLVKANKKKKIKGLFLGTCETGNLNIAKVLLEENQTHLDWIAGYSKSIDWIDGTALDMIFFSKLAEEYSINSSRKKKYSDRKMAHLAASKLLRLAPGAFTEYGFNIYFKEKGKLTSMFISDLD